MNRRSFIAAGVAALVASRSGLRAEVPIVCPRCGHEVKPGETVCPHCGTVLPKPHTEEKKTEAQPAPSDKNADVARQAMAVTQNSLRQAKELDETEPAVALCYYQNALAVMRLLPAGTLNAKAVEAIVDGNQRILHSLLRGRVMCRKCKGTGKFQLDVGKINHSTEIRAADGIPCPVCKGLGSVPGYRDVTKVKAELLQGRGEFERRQMAAGDVKLGRSLVPAKLEAALTNRQRALVMTGMPVPCSACQQTGRQTCAACKGTGRVKCDYKGCENGYIKESTTHKSGGVSKKTRLNDENKTRCPKCGGEGEISCSVCNGTGSVACKRCDGGGLAPSCSRCTGTGIIPCSKCKGTGEVKGSPCPDCKGETVVLCTTCRGEGAVAR